MQYPFYIDAGFRNPDGGYEKKRKEGRKQEKHTYPQSETLESSKRHFHVASIK
jgi:hypothetical protein